MVGIYTIQVCQIDQSKYFCDKNIPRTVNTKLLIDGNICNKTTATIKLMTGWILNPIDNPDKTPSQVK